MRNGQLLLLPLLFAMLLVGCSNSKLDIIGMPKPPKEGPPEYIAGWEAGCETGMTAYGNDNMRIRYRTNVDPEMMKDPNYNKGWELGNEYCRYYTSRYLALGYLDDTSGKSDLRDDNTWWNNSGFDLFKGWRYPSFEQDW